MIYKGSKKITKIFKGSTPVTKVYRGAVLVWQNILEYIQFNLAKYTSRVEADYGQVVDGTALNAEYLKPIEDSSYENAIAIYNPNGGYRTGKIYNIRNLDGVEPTYDLEVTGGGGTRILADGSLEELEYNLHKYAVYNVGLGSNWTQTGSISEALYKGLYYNIFEQTDTNQYVAIQNNFGENSGQYNYSIFLRKNNARYAEILVGSTTIPRVQKAFFVDLETGAIENLYTPSGNTELIISNLQVTQKEDGFYRLSLAWEQTTVRDQRIIIQAHQTLSSGDAVGDKIDIAFPQITKGAQVKPYQYIELTRSNIPNVKIDYSTGQPAFLIEPQRTNVFLYNTDLTNSYWESSNVIETGLLAPDKSNTAVRINGTFRNLNDYTYANDGTSSQVFSVWVRSNVNSTFRFNVKDEGTSQGYSPDFQATTEWQKFEYNPGHSGNPDINCRIQPDSQGNPLDVEIWGPQLEVNQKKATSTIITNGSAVTRTANAFITEELNIQPLQNVTFYCNIKPYLVNNNSYLSLLHSDNNDTPVYIGLNSQNELGVFSGGGSYIINSNPNLNINHKIAITRTGTNFKIFHNGSFITSYSHYVPDFGYNTISTALRNRTGGLGNLSYTGRIFGINLFNGALTDQEAIALTTL